MKKTLLVVFGVIVLLVAVVAIMAIGKYNQFVKLDQNVENQQAQVEVVLQRRFDLIPNLVESTKGVLKQEQKVFGDIAAARTKYGNAQSGSQEKVQAANELENSLSRLLVIVENYPELKSDQTVKSLMDELAGTENRIAVERRRYNDNATEYNSAIRTFPNSVFAGMFGFQKRPLFEAAQGADKAPQVNLSE